VGLLKSAKRCEQLKCSISPSIQGQNRDKTGGAVGIEILAGRHPARPLTPARGSTLTDVVAGRVELERLTTEREVVEDPETGPERHQFPNEHEACEVGA
jgi:hypothetical protein